MQVTPAVTDLPADQFVAAATTYSKAKRNVLKTLVIVCCGFILCSTSNQFFILLYFLGRDTDFTSWFYHFTVIAVFFNCCLNPFIYCLKYNEFRVGMRRLGQQMWQTFTDNTSRFDPHRHGSSRQGVSTVAVQWPSTGVSAREPARVVGDASFVGGRDDDAKVRVAT
jgi:hypothetical protein